MAQNEKPAKLSMANTKKEMLAEYKRAVEMLQEKRRNEIKPERAIQEKQAAAAVAGADKLSTEDIQNAISALRTEISNLLSSLPDKFADMLNQYEDLSKAVEVKKAEIKEMYEIDKNSETLAALIETQRSRQEEFEREMADRKRTLEEEISTTRQSWELERKRHEEEAKEAEALEKKQREREREEYRYQFDRERQLAQDTFNDEKEKFERELTKRREEIEAREAQVAQQEAELADLRARVEAIPKEVEKAAAAETKAALDRAAAESKAKEDLLRKQFEGERNVLNTKIAALEQSLKEMEQQSARLAAQLDNSYQQVQDIAVKAIEGTSSRAASAEEYSRRVSQTQNKQKEATSE